MKGKIILVLLVFCLPQPETGAKEHKVSPEHSYRAKDIVSKMTLQEKLDYIGGYESWYIRAIPRLGLPAVRMADGPQGVRNNTKSTLFPSGVTVAASWDRSLVEKMGIGLGQDAKARGVQILLGPGVNIYRSSVCGRNFEYYGEDPYLASEMAVSYINGLQSQNVMACIKHFAANNQEFDRHTASSDIDFRTLHEIYLMTFEKAVKKADVASIMASYNLVNSIHSTENSYLLKTVLRDEWGFKGILMSDWTSTYSPLNAATGGLDLEMPNARAMAPANLRPLIENGVLDERYIDEKCINIIQTILAWGWDDKSYSPTDTSIPLDNPFSDSVSLDIARSSMTLLVNDGFLPISKGTFYVCGPHSNIVVTGSGSGKVSPIHTCTVYEGMKSLVKKVEVSEPTEFDNSYASMCYVDKDCTTKGIKCEFFKGNEPKGKAVSSMFCNDLNFNWGNDAPCAGLPKDKFSAKFTFWFKPEKDEYRIFRIGSDDGFRIFVDGQKLCGLWHSHSYKHFDGARFFEAGKVYKFVIDYFDENGGAAIDLESSTCLFGNDKEIQELAKADCAVVCFGFSGRTEGEGFDRSFELPGEQKEFIEKIHKINPNIIAVVNAGGAFEMASWKDKVKAVIWAGYSGQMGGQAIAEIITGKVCPSGRLPFSFENKPEDNPTKDSYYRNVPVVRNSPYTRIQYNEGLFMGYRGYDKNGKRPMFPFGFGLSYTQFLYSDLHISETEDGDYELSFNVKNTGRMDGADVAQIYIRDLNPSHIRPARELKGFSKFFIKKGKESRIVITLPREEAFRQYDSFEKCFRINPGEYEILVGRSASDIQLSQTVTVK